MKNVKLPIFMCSLLIFLIFYPYLHQKFPDYLFIVELFFALIMIAGVNLFVYKKNLLILMSILAILILGGILMTAYSNNFNGIFIVLLIELVFFAVIFVSLLKYIYEQREVTLNKIYAAITSYLVLGMVFAVLYTIIAILSPDSFQYTLAINMKAIKIFPHPSFFSEALYFSFVTLSTLGYGDWVPILGPIKMIAALEAIVGQLFSATVLTLIVIPAVYYVWKKNTVVIK